MRLLPLIHLQSLNTEVENIGFFNGSHYDYYDGHADRTFNLRPGSSTEEQVTTLTYDFADRLIQQTRPNGGTTSHHFWDNWGYRNTATSTNTGQFHYEFQEFDGAGRVRRKANDNPDGVSGKYSGQQFVIDKVGMQSDQSNVIAIYGDWTPRDEDAATGWMFTNTSRDELTRLKLITRPDGNTMQYDYTGCGCAGGSTMTETDEAGCQVKTETDFLGRVWEVTEFSAPSTPYSQVTYTYDALDRITQIVHANGSGSQYQTRSFIYDGYGRLQSETNPESGTITYAYKPNDLVETVSDQRGIVRTYGYNTRNLTTNVSYNDGGATPSVTFGYDEFGSRTSMADGEGTTTYVYNSFRQLQSESRGLPNSRTSKLTYTYNLANQAKQVNYAIYNGQTATFSKNINYARNNTGAISGIGTNLIGTDPNANANVASAIGYRAWNAYRSMNFGNGLRLTVGHHSQRLQMTSFVVDTQNGSSVLWRQHYDYYESGKNNGRIRRLSDQPDFSTYNKYHYDSYNRLTLVQMHPSLAWHAAYSYDEWGNIRTINSVASGGATLTYQTNATGAPTNRLSTAGAFSFGYDAVGNMTAGNGTTFSYDAANRLKGTGGVANQYGYDGDGKRVRQPGLYYVWSSVLDKVAFEVDANANVQRAFVYLGSEVIALQSTDGNFYWAHTDHLSSGRMLTNTVGAVIYRGDFDPFGQAYYEWSSSGNVNLNTRKFTGYERDATGLDYARARSYTSSWGRFIQSDPLGSGHQGQRPNPMGAAKNDRPQTLNRYGYVSNDPVNLTDPSGLLVRNPDDGCICCGGDPGGGGVIETCAQCVKREQDNCNDDLKSCVHRVDAAAAGLLIACLALLGVPVIGLGLFIACLGVGLYGAEKLIEACVTDYRKCWRNAIIKCPQCI